MPEDVQDHETPLLRNQVLDQTPLVLTQRDIAVFQFVHEQRYVCYNQIHDSFWKDRSEDAKACWHRVERLVEAGFLIKEYNPRKKSNLYLATEKSVAELKARGLDSGIPAAKLTRDFARYVSHDLNVTNIRMLFHDLGLTNWTSERVLRERDHLYNLPDGVLTVRGSRIAVEFENMLVKGKNRYQEMFEYYDSFGGYKLVFVIILKDLKDWLFDLHYDARKIWFANFEDLIKEKEKTLFENARGSFELRRLL